MTETTLSAMIAANAELHSWRPAKFIREMAPHFAQQGIPWCTGCADWHQLTEEHSDTDRHRCRPAWRNTRPATFDTEAKPQPLALFPAPDPAGTPDLFDAAELPDQCPICGAPLARGPFGYLACSRSGPGHYSRPAT